MGLHLGKEPNGSFRLFRRPRQIDRALRAPIHPTLKGNDKFVGLMIQIGDGIAYLIAHGINVARLILIGRDKNQVDNTHKKLHLLSK